MPNLAKPLVALILGVLPFFLFIGTSSVTKVNSEVVSDSSFNLGGIVLALIGITLAWNVLSERGPGQVARKSLAGLAGGICALQLISTGGLWRIDPLDWLMPDRNLLAPGYTQLSERDRIVLLPESEDNYRRTLAHTKAEIIRDARLHNAYAALCHGGRSRVDLVRAEALPDFFDAALQERLSAGVERMQADPPAGCSDRDSIRIMAALADEANRRMDLFDRLADDYRSFSNTAALP